MKAIIKKTALNLSVLTILATSAMAENHTFTFNINAGEPVVKKEGSKNFTTSTSVKNKTDVIHNKIQAAPRYNELYSIKRQKEVNQYNRINNVNRYNSLNSTIENLAQRLLDSSRVKQSSLEDIAITSFVDLHKFNKTTHFGRNISESFFD